MVAEDKKPDDADLLKELQKLQSFVDALEMKFGPDALAVAEKQLAQARQAEDGALETWEAIVKVIRARATPQA